MCTKRPNTKSLVFTNSENFFAQFQHFLEIKEKNESFGTSLLLANIGPNSPMSPKIVDGSFAALFDNNEVRKSSISFPDWVDFEVSQRLVFYLYLII